MESRRIPILKIEDVLIASIQTTLHDSSAVQFTGDVAITPVELPRVLTALNQETGLVLRRQVEESRDGAG